MDQAAFFNASTVTLIVHGVGDHASGDVLQSVRKAYRAYTLRVGLDLAIEEDIDFSSLLPGSHGGDVSLSGLRVAFDNRTHVVAALDWSHTRSRLTKKDRELSKQKLGSSQFGNAARALSALFSLAATVTDLIDLLRPANWQASRAWVRAAAAVILAACSAYGIGLLAAACLSLILFFAPHLDNAPIPEGLMPALIRSVPSCVHEQAEWKIYVFFCASYTLPGLYLSTLGVWDLLQDIISYVVDGRRRGNLIETLSTTISRVDEYRADAPLVLVGHSLGSVLLTHSIPELKGKGGAVLITCGSPLELMANAFPKAISTSRAVATGNIGPSRVRKWLNLYRDGDLVGRSLGVAPFTDFSDESIGDGGHADYYSDIRFWRAVLAAAAGMDAQRSSTGREIPGQTEKDLQEIFDLRELENFSPFVGLLSIILTLAVIQGYLWPEGSSGLLCFWWAPVCILLAATALSLAIQFSIIFCVRIQRRKWEEITVQRYRLWRWPLWYATLGSAIFPLLALALCWQFS
jgi:hypothetical protein